MGPETMKKIMIININKLLLLAFLASPITTAYAEPVKEFQEDVKEFGNALKGLFGKKTKKEEDETQKKEVEPQEGEYVEETQKNEVLSQPAYNQDARLVEDAQKELKRIGYPVSVDGDYGPGTRKSILEFEVDSGRVQSGNVSPELIVALKASDPKPSSNALNTKSDPAWAQMAASSAVVLASVQPAPATPGDEPRAESVPESLSTMVAITARKPGGSSPLENMQWTIINQSTEEMLIPESESGAISVELAPGRYDVLVVSDGYEGETTIEVEPGSNQYAVDLQARGVADSFSSPDTVPAGEIMSFEWKGPAGEKDRIFIARLDMAENRYKTSNVHSASGGSPAVLITPALPGAYEIRYYSGANGSVAFRKALEVTAAEVRISAPGELIAGTEFTFAWEGPNVNGDRLFLAKPEMDASRYYTDSDVSHMVTAGPSANLIAPVKAGDYEIRYYSSANGLPLVRYPIRVTPHAVKIDAPRTVAPGAEFAYTWTGPDAKGDFLFVAKPDLEANKYWVGTGILTKHGPSGKFTAPTEPGAYEIRYFSSRNGAMLAKRVFMVR